MGVSVGGNSPLQNFNYSKKGVCMKASQYLLVFPSSDQADQSIVSSFPQGAKISVPAHVADAIQDGDVPDDVAEQLAGLGIMVPDLEKEKEQVVSFFDQVDEELTSMRVAVILSLECNFHCRYCYEGTMKGKEQMSDETALQLVEYLKEQFDDHKKALTLDFYGGEPLLSTARIIFIAEKIKPYIEEKGGEFEFTLVTNGSLLTKPTVEKLKKYGLTRARVTIDGPPEEHNRYRPFKNGTESFDCIVNNLKAVCDTIQIGIGGNFTKDNYKRFPELLDILQERGLTPDKIPQVKFTQAMQTNNKFTLSGFSEGCSSVDEPWVAEATLYLREEILKRGFKTPKTTVASCMIEMPESFAVHCDGTIYKCTALIGHQEYAVGEVWSGIGEYRNLYGLDNWRNNSDCKECRYLPLCYGGCRYAKLQSSGTMNEVNCMKNFLETALPTMIQQDVKYQSGANR